MAETGYRDRLLFRARRTNPGELGAYRLASSVKLPWGIGLSALLILAAASAVLVGRTGESTLRVPQAVLDYQEQIAHDAAQATRRSLNAGVRDLDQLARVAASAEATDLPHLRASLLEFAQSHGRYTSVVAVDGRGRVLVLAGSAPPQVGLGSQAPRVVGPGMREVPQPSGKRPLIQQFAPVTAARSRVRTLIGYYDPSFMQFPLDVSRPGHAWVVNRRGQTVGARGARPVLGSLPSLRLREAAVRAVSNISGAQSIGGSIESQEVVSHVPVTGGGPAGQLGWGVVATRSVSSYALPHTEARRQGVIVGVVLGVLAILIFAWLYVVVLKPLIRLQEEAERVAYGDLSNSVEVVRYDEIGLVARALERLRVTLIRKRVQSMPRKASGNGKPPRRPVSKP
jgi:HAMP domain-containing protein